MKRVLTAAIGAPLALAAVLYLPRVALFLLFVAIFEIAVWEFVRIARVWAPAAPNGALLLLVPVAALLLAPGILGGGQVSFEHLFGVTLLVGGGASGIFLLSRAPVHESLTGIGVLAFGTVYFALPVASLDLLYGIDRSLVILLLAIVWLGDTAAFYTGRLLGRHKLAPIVSPNKTWEGAAGALLAGCAAGAVWSALRIGRVSWELIALAAATSVAAQFGDLVESVIKRGAGVKDSGALLPGHGGMLDRLDSLIFAAPVLALGFWIYLY